MLVRMLRPERIAANGRDTKWHKEGEILDLPAPLAESMIRADAAVEVHDDEPLPAHQAKAEMKPLRKTNRR